MSTIVDARGLSCPQPVLLVLDAMKKINKGEVIILVDTDTSKENVSRAATNQGWQVKSVDPEGIGYRISISKE
ncbi:MAG: preprotein translocase subunit TatB [Deltaproteobacteria bacterium]|nr:preprotein translocase subunit TatB [Deltaproteobacteria bacterium]MBM4347502.1 preprotein translocase subunit TatB [Deltaproteobacteria bacterium]